MAPFYFAAFDLAGYLDTAATEQPSPEHSVVWHCPFLKPPSQVTVWSRGSSSTEHSGITATIITGIMILIVITLIIIEPYY